MVNIKANAFRLRQYPGLTQPLEPQIMHRHGRKRRSTRELLSNQLQR
jgi:hypothetical protein